VFSRRASTIARHSRQRASETVNETLFLAVARTGFQIKGTHARRCKIINLHCQGETMNDPKTFNPTFNPGAAGTRSYNACVGNNGFVDSRSYGDGFAEAVDLLTHALESDDHRGQLDTLIYPICFCARHHVELFLKEQIEAIEKMRGVRPDLSVSGTHDLSNLWDALVKVAGLTDSRFDAPLVQMKSTISDIAQIDPTGQTFRYPANTESAKHLVQTPVINVPTLRRQFMALAERIKEFQYLCDAVSDEYRRGTFTSKLSRHDLEMIARALPPRDAWARGVEFDETKRRLMEKHGLSGKDFIRAIDLIQKHREFCSHLGMNMPIPHIDTASLDRLNQFFNDQIRFEDLPRLELIAFSAILDMASPSLYSEDYERVEASFAIDFDASHWEHSEVKRWPRQLSKIAAGLRKLGQLKLADYLDEHASPDSSIRKQELESLDVETWRARLRSKRSENIIDDADADAAL
jgi:hypothetical protein